MDISIKNFELDKNKNKNSETPTSKKFDNNNNTLNIEIQINNFNTLERFTIYASRFISHSVF